MRLAGIALVVAVVCAGALAHPQDGPDVDVRVQIADDGVTMALAFNLSYLDAYGLAPRESPDELHPVEQEAVRAAVLSFVGERNSVSIDGVEVAPVLVEWEVPEPDRSLLALFPRNGMAALARVRMVLEYPAKSEPERVAIAWGAFPVDAVLSTPEDERTIVIAAQMWANGVSWVQELRAEAPSYTWLASDAAAGGVMLEVPPVSARVGWSVRVPVVSLSLLAGGVVLGAGIVGFGRARGRWTVALAMLPVFVVGAAAVRDVRVTIEDRGWPEIGEAEARAIFEPLHTNIYRSFDYTEEEDVYDALARSVSGELLDELYSEVYAGLEMQLEEGAAVSRVQSVEHLETTLTGQGEPAAARLTFEVTSTWRVTGAVFHWGHSHTRTNEYRARYTVAGTDGGWRIVGTTMLEQSRVDAAPGDPGGILRPGLEL